ncbi:MAG: hypothetical protein SPL86_09455 [Succiniclasticum sp.]|uniref:hypothetical protein n=1 Tax=Succiniclasticum sp. TaxID=2775030 RepID=UPI002A914878|nr:hypothetical protein [Succiniclasticum sp.]MDY6291694.1 hypothetical protein [Succiniclasticum sp.]
MGLFGELLGNALLNSQAIATAGRVSAVHGRIEICFICGSDAIVIPIVPNPGPEIEEPQNNEVFEAITGDLKVIGNMGLRKFTLESFWPTRKYSFTRPYGTDGVQCLNFFTRNRKLLKPIRCIMVHANGEDLLNMLVLVDDFSHHTDKMGDIHYRLQCCEYPVIKNQVIKWQLG